jgi:hypothetical protein
MMTEKHTFQEMKQVVLCAKYKYFTKAKIRKQTLKLFMKAKRWSIV